MYQNQPCGRLTDQGSRRRKEQVRMGRVCQSGKGPEMAAYCGGKELRERNGFDAAIYITSQVMLFG